MTPEERVKFLCERFGELEWIQDGNGYLTEAIAAAIREAAVAEWLACQADCKAQFVQSDLRRVDNEAVIKCLNAIVERGWKNGYSVGG